MRHPHAHREEYDAFVASQRRADRKVARRTLALSLRRQAEDLDEEEAEARADALEDNINRRLADLATAIRNLQVHHG